MDTRLISAVYIDKSSNKHFHNAVHGHLFHRWLKKKKKKISHFCWLLYCICVWVCSQMCVFTLGCNDLWNYLLPFRAGAFEEQQPSVRTCYSTTASARSTEDQQLRGHPCIKHCYLTRTHTLSLKKRRRHMINSVHSYHVWLRKWTQHDRLSLARGTVSVR